MEENKKNGKPKINGFYGRTPRSVIWAEISVGAKALFAALDDFNSTQKGCFPAETTLAAAFRTTTRTIRRWVSELEQAELISTGKVGRKKKYHLDYGEMDKNSKDAKAPKPWDDDPEMEWIYQTKGHITILHYGREVYQKKGQYDRAIRCFRRVIELVEAAAQADRLGPLDSAYYQDAKERLEQLENRT